MYTRSIILLKLLGVSFYGYSEYQLLLCFANSAVEAILYMHRLPTGVNKGERFVGYYWDVDLCVYI